MINLKEKKCLLSSNKSNEKKMKTMKKQRKTLTSHGGRDFKRSGPKQAIVQSVTVVEPHNHGSIFQTVVRLKHVAVAVAVVTAAHPVVGEQSGVDQGCGLRVGGRGVLVSHGKRKLRTVQHRLLHLVVLGSLVGVVWLSCVDCRQIRLCVGWKREWRRGGHGQEQHRTN